MNGLLEYFPLSRLTTFHIGGPARFFAEPKTLGSLQSLIAWAGEKKIPYYVIGQGSNLLVDDGGFPGLIIRLPRSTWSCMSLADKELTVDAGVSLGSFCSFCAQNGIGGFEFLCGIPGSMGGAVRMNAGAHGKSIGECVKSVRFLHKNGTEVSGALPHFAYRHSRLDGLSVLLSITLLRGEPATPEEIQAKQRELVLWRRNHQPRQPSAGSIFKNPEGLAAGKLIDEVGLKGHSIGGAQISQLHGNFIINRGNATCEDVLALIKLAQRMVFQRFAIDLQLEVRYLSSDVFGIG
jgi:UDP-N-acetylmuramate dehydrogenase